MGLVVLSLVFIGFLYLPHEFLFCSHCPHIRSVIGIEISADVSTSDSVIKIKFDATAAGSQQGLV